MTEVAARPIIPASRYAERLEAARRLIHDRGIGALLVGVGPDLRYLSGYVAMPLERLTMIVVRAGAPPVLVVPRLEADPAHRSPAAASGAVEIVTWEETEDPHKLVAAAAQVGGPWPGTDRPATFAVNDTLWASHLLRLQAVLPGARFDRASTVLRELRMIKDADEIDLLRLAALAADRVVDQIAAGRLVDRTEADVARETRERLNAEGHETADFAIVASGPNAASPHHEASDRVIRAGEPIVLDIGGILAGYASDTTRTLWPTGSDSDRTPDPEFLSAFEVLRRAQAAATAAVRPGVALERIDSTAREIIGDAGYGPNFIHRTGHGIGLEVHEEPYLVSGNAEPLRAGMAFSVEPGIYVEGRWGMRLEDIVVCGPSGPDSLNRSSLELRVVSGT
jgi:Xaa-Pro aminopeptidase